MAGSFSVDLNRFIARAGRNANAVVRKVTLDLGTAIIEKTPVGDPDTWAPGTPVPEGYVGGRARGSWQYAKSVPNTSDPNTIDGSGATSIGRVAAGVNYGDPMTVHYITNSLPYIRRLEYEGWSQQAPDGMVRKTVAEFMTHVQNAVRSLP